MAKSLRWIERTDPYHFIRLIRIGDHVRGTSCLLRGSDWISGGLIH